MGQSGRRDYGSQSDSGIRRFDAYSVRSILSWAHGSQRYRSGTRVLALAVLAIVAAIAAGNACTVLLREVSKGPPSLFVVVENTESDEDSAFYAPRQVRLEIGSRCIVGHARDGAQLLLLFEVGHELIESAEGRYISQVFRPDLSGWQQAELGRRDLAMQSDARLPNSISHRYITPGGTHVYRDSEGFWLDAHGHDPINEELVVAGDVVSGEIMLVSTRPFAAHRLKWITTPYAECEALPYAYVPTDYPS